MLSNSDPDSATAPADSTSADSTPVDSTSVDSTSADRARERRRRAWRGHIDPGPKAFLIVVLLVVLICSALLPWVGDAPGWQVLAGQADDSLHVGLLPRLFSINATIAGVGLSALAVSTRRWALAFAAAAGCGIVAFEGIVAVWSRQTVPEAGPSIGLALAVLCMFALAVQWLRIIWSQD